MFQLALMIPTRGPRELNYQNQIEGKLSLFGSIPQKQSRDCIAHFEVEQSILFNVETLRNRVE